LTYAITTPPSHGTITNFNAATGSLLYTPNAGYDGPDSFKFTVSSTGPASSPATLSSNPAAVGITITAPHDDFAGLGKSQLAVFRPSNAQWFALGTSGTQSLGGFGVTKLADIPAPGDYAGLGHIQLGVFRPATSQWFALEAHGGTLLGTFGASTDIPVPGDYLGLGHDELAVFRPSTSQWFVLSPTGGRLLGSFGGPGDVPVPGDYDGVGHTELAVFRLSTSQWFVLGPSGGHLVGTFGATNLKDVPVPGDYDGVGHDELAVFRPATAQWFVLSTTGGRLMGTFGGTNLFDLPAEEPAAMLDRLGAFSGIHFTSARSVRGGAPLALSDVPLEPGALGGTESSSDAGAAIPESTAAVRARTRPAQAVRTSTLRM
jgi:allophanate hydrolase subunit 1